jgi:hypothetical protein
MTADPGWEADVIAALGGLTEADMPAVEFLLLDQLALWMLSDANPASAAYDEVAGGVVLSALLNAVANAGDVRPEREPVVGPEIAEARRRFVEGAREYAAHERGIALVVTRLMPAAIAELNTNVGNAAQQIYWTYLYSLFVIASGVVGEQDPSVARGIGMSFSGWNDLIADGLRLPGVRR